MKSVESRNEAALTEVFSVFKEVTTKLLRTSSRTMRRVIFSKNNEGKSSRFKFKLPPYNF